MSRAVSEYISILIYGLNRVGKTTLACDFPKPLLLVSFEPAEKGGADSVAKVPGVTFLHLSSTDDGTRLCGDLRQDPRSNWRRTKSGLVPIEDADGNPVYTGDPFQTVVVDTVTSYQDLVLQEICGWKELPVQMNFGGVTGDQYRYRSEKTRMGLQGFNDVPGVHRVFLGKERDHNPPKEEKYSASGKLQPDMRPRFLRGMQPDSYVAADLGGATAGWIQDVCNCVGRLYFDKEVVRKKHVVNGREEWGPPQETGKFVRCLRTQYHPNYAAGIRSASPDTIPEYIEDPTYEKIAAVLRGEWTPDRG